MGETLRSSIEAAFLNWGRSRGLSRCPTASIGIVEAHLGNTFEQVIGKMDDARSRAKREGKSRVILFPCSSR